MLREIDLVEEDDAVAILRDFQQLAILIGQRFTGIEDKKDQVGFFKGFARALHTDAFDDVLGLADTGCIDQLERNTVDVDVFLDDVPGCPFDIGHDGFFLAQEVVEKAGLPDVWTADDSSRDPFAEDFTTASCLEEIGQEGFKFSRLLTDDLSCCFLDIVVLRIVDVDFDLSQSIEDLLARVVDEVR